VRDWSFPYEAAYGADGGHTILQRRLKVTATLLPSLYPLFSHNIYLFTAMVFYK
jgi:atlastin